MIESQRSPIRAFAAQRTFPDDCHPPPGGQQFLSHPTVPRHVAPEFRLPKVRPCGGDGRIWAFFMTMPEAAMHETDSSKPTEDQVRRPRQLPVVKTVSETARVQRASKRHLRFRVFAANAGHHSRPNGWINYIDHGRSCIAWKERFRVRTPQGMLEAIKEDAVIVRTTARSGPGLPRATIRVRDTSLMDQLQRRAPISHLTTRGSCLAIGHPAITFPHADLRPPCHD